MRDTEKEIRRDRRLRRLIAAVGLPAAVTLVALEILLRVFDPVGIAYFSEAERYFRQMQADDAFAYIHPAGLRDTFQGVDVSINSHGLRGPEWSDEKPPGVYRLLILGDSVVFGWGAPQDSTFPARLQRRFDAEGKPVEVIPVGVGSWNTRTEYEYLRTRGLGFEPDAIVLVTTSNDIAPNLGGRTDIDRKLLSESERRRTAVRRLVSGVWKIAGKRSYVLSYVQYFLRRHSKEKGDLATGDDSPRWKDARAALKGIIDICRDGRVRLIVCLYGADAKLRDDPVLRLYREFLDANGVSFFSVPDVLFHDNRYRNSFVDGHANSRGHELIAGRVWEVLAPILAQPSAQPSGGSKNGAYGE